MGHYRGTAWADYDNDGFMDCFVGGDQSPAKLFHNDGNGNHWLKLRLVGTASNRSAIGAKARVIAQISGKQIQQLRELSSQTGYGGHDSQILHFGLGDATNVDRIRIEWPSGIVIEMNNMLPNTTLTILEQPRLTITRAPSGLTLTWPGSGFTLQQATILTGSPTDWTDIPSASSPGSVA